MPPGEHSHPRHLAVGYLAKAHGTKGELFVRPLTDHPEGTYVPGVVVLLGHVEAEAPDPDLPPLRIQAVRPFRDGYLATFHGVEDRTQAELLCPTYAYRDVSELEPLADDEWFEYQIVGMEVFTVEGMRVGTVTHVHDLRPAELLEVRGEDKEYMIPFLDEIVREVDTGEGRIVIDPPDGLLEL
ncbi:MAG: ribosome maturation factor RimM [Gemmatimonadota bacterium]|nr:ribosome maturation factor RimM [Gemmatimonadota bacterium]